MLQETPVKREEQVARVLQVQLVMMAEQVPPETPVLRVLLAEPAELEALV